MVFRDFYKKYENFILASAVLAALLLFVGIRYDYYYDLNGLYRRTGRSQHTGPVSFEPGD